MANGAGFIATDPVLERAVCAVLMRDPGARMVVGEVSAAQVLVAFYDDGMRSLAELCLSTKERVTPAAARGKLPPDSVDPSRVYAAYAAEEGGEVFVALLDRLLTLKMQRDALDAVAPFAQKWAGGEVPAVRGDLAQVVDSLTSLSRSAGELLDPTVRARIGVIRQRLASGKVGRRAMTGLMELDAATGGIDLAGADFWVVGGEAKVGKTRTVLSILAHLFRTVPDLRCCWISTEAGFGPEKIAGMLVAQAATDYLRERGLSSNVSAMMYMSGAFQRDSTASEALAYAADAVSGWSLRIYGPAERDGSARLLSNAIPLAAMAVDIHGCNLIVLDNFQQLTVPATDASEMSDYHTMIVAVPRFSNLASSRGVALIGVSQLNRGLQILGGGKVEYDANVVLHLSRSSKGVVLMDDEILLRCVMAREGYPFKAKLRFHPQSGLILGTEPVP